MICQGVNLLGQMSGALAVAVMVLTFIIHVCFATAVVQDIGRGQQDGRNPWLVGTEVWALATLFGGALSLPFIG
jgi:hypothetical protein